MATRSLQPMGVLERQQSGASIHLVWNVMEYVLDAWHVSGLCASLDVDVVPAVRRMVTARRLV